MIKQRIIRWLKRDWYQDEAVTAVPPPVESGISMRDAMDFSLVKADGGYIVQYRKFDPRTHENEYNLHIITSDEDVGERIGQIITIELMRN